MKAKLVNLASLFSVIVVSAFLPVQAQPLHDIQLKQKIRIAEGVASGELTRRETRQALQGQAQLERMEQRAKADGKVTRKERQRLQQKAALESLELAANKSDRQTRQ